VPVIEDFPRLALHLQNISACGGGKTLQGPRNRKVI